MKNVHAMKRILSASAVLAAAAAFAVPSIDPASVSLTQNPNTRLVTVQYTLTGDPAVVTVDFQTNNVSSGTWASIGGDKYSRLVGDVNKLVTSIGTTSTIYWQPTKKDGWPNQHIEGSSFRAVVKAWATNAPPPYMIIDLQDNPGEARYYPSAEAIPYGITNDLYKTTRLAFRLVPAELVTYRMGAPSGETGQGYPSRETQHLVTFTNDWYMGVYPVTQGQNSFFGLASITDAAKQLKAYPSKVTNDIPATATFPVDSVIWTALRGYYVDGSTKGNWPNDGHELSPSSGIYEARRVTGLPSLDLPTDAMWEYACRAGTTTATYAGNITQTSDSVLDPVLDEIAWYKVNSGGVTHPVGLKKQNAWGFYDMLGNVMEWCLDKYDVRSGQSGLMPSDSVTDPPGPADTGTSWPCRIVRGGGYDLSAKYCRSGCRDLNRYSHDGSTARSPLLKMAGYRLCCDAMALK